MFDFCRFSSYNFDIMGSLAAVLFCKLSSCSFVFIGSLVAVLVGSLSVALFLRFRKCLVK